MDDKPAKYESPRERPNRVYLPPRSREVFAEPSVRLLITEGEKKALAADQHGYACAGLVGVDCWSKKREDENDPRELHPDLAEFALAGRAVVIVFGRTIAGRERLSGHCRNASLPKARLSRSCDCRPCWAAPRSGLMTTSSLTVQPRSPSCSPAPHRQPCPRSGSRTRRGSRTPRSRPRRWTFRARLRTRPPNWWAPRAAGRGVSGVCSSCPIRPAMCAPSRTRTNCSTSPVAYSRGVVACRG